MIPAVAALELVVFLAVIALLITGAVVGWERYRGRGTPGARPTQEIFIDPETGRPTRVWYDSVTGTRDYRSE